MSGTSEDPIVILDDVSEFELSRSDNEWSPSPPAETVNPRSELHRSSALREGGTVTNHLGVIIDTYPDGSWHMTIHANAHSMSMYHLLLMAWTFCALLLITIYHEPY